MKTESGLYQALEDILRKAREPMTCVQMFEYAEVREHAQSANRVSDYLGGLWRKGLVVRMPAPRVDQSAARWMYAWKTAARRTRSNVVEYVGPKRTMNIRQEGDEVIIDMPNFQIRVKSKT